MKPCVFCCEELKIMLEQMNNDKMSFTNKTQLELDSQC